MSNATATKERLSSTRSSATSKGDDNGLASISNHN